MMHLKWIATRGPMPVRFDAGLATVIMRIAYYFLFNFGKGLGHFHRVDHNLLQSFSIAWQVALPSFFVPPVR